MNLYLFLIVVFLSFAVQAEIEVNFDSKTSICANFVGNQLTGGYKIYKLNEQVDSNGAYEFTFDALEGIRSTIALKEEITYQNASQVLKDRHGNVVDDIANHLGLYVLHDGVEEEITSSALDLRPINSTVEKTQTKQFGGFAYYRMKNEERIYANVTIFVTSRFTIHCLDP